MEHPAATVPSKNATTVTDMASPVADKRLSMILTGGLRTLPASLLKCILTDYDSCGVAIDCA
jgi:hypothetical protein